MTPTPGCRFRTADQTKERYAIDVSHWNGMIYYRTRYENHGDKRKVHSCTHLRWVHWCNINHATLVE